LIRTSAAALRAHRSFADLLFRLFRALTRPHAQLSPDRSTRKQRVTGDLID
jgi:hypothetical protein